MQLDDEAIALKLASLRKKGRSKVRRGSSSSSIAAPPRRNQQQQQQADSPASLPGSMGDDVPVWPVPEHMRMPDAEGCPAEAHGRHLSLDDLFPGSGLGEAWDTCAPLRTAMRRALRSDLFTPPPSWNEVQRRAATGLEAACMVPWHGVVADTDADAARLQSFSEAFAEHGVALDGQTFLRTLGGLCGARPHGTLIDIVPLHRKVAHSWHQDSGISSTTVLLGFPPTDGYEGGGVFSHHVKLSHPLRPSAGEVHGQVVEYERLGEDGAAGGPPPPIPDEYVVRPTYRRGCEVWVSDDAFHLHSTPDVQRRECLWRFM